MYRKVAVLLVMTFLLASTSFAQDLKIGSMDQCSSPGGNHQAFSSSQFVAEGSFQRAEMRFSLLLKDLRNPHALSALDEGIHIHKLPAQTAGGLPPHGGLAGTHEPGQDQVLGPQAR